MEDANHSQRHRNFFTLRYSIDGRLLPSRDMLIFDRDEDANGLGDRTGLRVGIGPCPSNATTTQYHDQDDSLGAQSLDAAGTAIGFLVVDDNDIAINLPSVDGLLVYDDSLLRDVPTGEKQGYLLRKAQPLYVSRLTGVMIRGPVGDSEVTPP